MRSLVLALCLLISSCSMLASLAKDAVLGGKGPSLEVDTDLVNGTNDKSVHTQLEVGGKREVGKVDQYIETTNNNVDIYLLIFLVLGWLMPDPGKIYTEIKSWFKRE